MNGTRLEAITSPLHFSIQFNQQKPRNMVGARTFEVEQASLLFSKSTEHTSQKTIIYHIKSHMAFVLIFCLHNVE